MSDLFSSLLIFTIIRTILSTFFLLFLNFTKIFVQRSRNDNSGQRMQRSLYTTSPDDDKLQKSKSIDVVLSICFRKKYYMSRNNSRILVEQSLNFIHWKHKIFNTSFNCTLLVPNKPESLANLWIIVIERHFVVYFISRRKSRVLFTFLFTLSMNY